MANLIYLQEEARVEPTFNPTSLADQGVYVSSIVDLGPDPRALEYSWRCVLRSGTAATVGSVCELWYTTRHSDTTGQGDEWDGDISEADSATGFDEDQVKGCHPLGFVRIHSSATNEDFVASGSVMIPARYVKFIVVNKSGQGLSATAADNTFMLWPNPMEAQ